MAASIRELSGKYFIVRRGRISSLYLWKTRDEGLGMMQSKALIFTGTYNRCLKEYRKLTKEVFLS